MGRRLIILIMESSSEKIQKYYLKSIRIQKPKANINAKLSISYFSVISKIGYLLINGKLFYHGEIEIMY